MASEQKIANPGERALWTSSLVPPVCVRSSWGYNDSGLTLMLCCLVDKEYTSIGLQGHTTILESFSLI